MLIREKTENLNNHKEHQNHPIIPPTKKEPLKSHVVKPDIYKAHKVVTCREGKGKMF